MQVTQVVGVDPGLVHTGCVSLLFSPSMRTVDVKHEAIAGPDPVAVKGWILQQAGPHPSIFIEGYRPRSHFDSDARMSEAVGKIRVATRGQVLNNTGVKKVIRQPLMELLGCWKFSTVTHHQDLRSAARIALLGMVKDEWLNKLLYQVVSDHLDGNSWHVHH